MHAPLPQGIAAASDPVGTAGPLALASASSTWYVKRLHLRRLLRPRGAELLLSGSTLVSAHRGALLFDPQSAGDTVWWIEEGRLRLSRFRAGGQETVAAVLEEGEILGQEWRSPFAVNDAFAEVIDSGEFRCVARAHFEAVLEDEATAATSIAHQIAHQAGLAGLPSWWGQRGVRDARARVAEVLLVCVSPPEFTELPRFSLQEWALLSGLGREELDGAMRSWADAGAIRLREGRVRIENAATLAPQRTSR